MCIVLLLEKISIYYKFDIYLKQNVYNWQKKCIPNNDSHTFKQPVKLYTGLGP